MNGKLCIAAHAHMWYICGCAVIYLVSEASLQWEVDEKLRIAAHAHMMCICVCCTFVTSACMEDFMVSTLKRKWSS